MPLCATTLVALFAAVVTSCKATEKASYESLPPTNELVAPLAAPLQASTQEAGAPMPAGWAEFLDEYRPDGPQAGDYEVVVAAVGSSNQDFDTGGVNIAGSFGKFLSDKSQNLVRQGMQLSDFGNS